MNPYEEMKERQQRQLSEFLKENAFFAFSTSQYEAGLRKLGFAPDKRGEVVPIGGTGGYILKDKYQEFIDIVMENKKERDTALTDPETREQFAFDMFRTELINHEYGYTGNAMDALNALGFSANDLLRYPFLNRAFDKAKRSITAQ